MSAWEGIGVLPELVCIPLRNAPPGSFVPCLAFLAAAIAAGKPC